MFVGSNDVKVYVLQHEHCIRNGRCSQAYTHDQLPLQQNMVSPLATQMAMTMILLFFIRAVVFIHTDLFPCFFFLLLVKNNLQHTSYQRSKITYNFVSVFSTSYFYIPSGIFYLYEIYNVSNNDDFHTV